MKIIALAGQKGGSGKSTTALCIGTELQARGAKVLIADADPQGSAVQFAARAAQNGHPCPETIAVDNSLRAGRRDVIYLAQGYDWAIIDCPPRLGRVETLALMAADLALLPYQPSGNDQNALWGSVTIAREIQAKRDLFVALFLTCLPPRTVIAREARESLGAFGLPVLRSQFLFRVPFREFTFLGQGLTAYAPRDEASNEVKCLVDELEAYRAQKTQYRGSRPSGTALSLATR